MAASISKSIPAQNPLPAPVTITTREWLFSIAYSALCSSAIIWVLMALRLSGRFSVILAISPLNSSIRVEYMARSLANSKLAHAHISRESHWSWPEPSPGARCRCRDQRRLCAALRAPVRWRCSPPDCLPQRDSRQAPSARCQIAGIPPRMRQEFSLPRSPAGCAGACPARLLRHGPSLGERDRRLVAGRPCLPYPPAKRCAREHLSATPACL